LGHGGEDGIEVAFGVRMQDMELQPNRASRLQHFSQ